MASLRHVLNQLKYSQTLFNKRHLYSCTNLSRHDLSQNYSLKNGSQITWSDHNVHKVSSHQRTCNSYLLNRHIHSSAVDHKVVPFLLADIGEGIKEVIVKEWYVKEGDKVSEFDMICEVQSDKASVTISSRYEGVIQKLHHQVDGTALVGQPLVDIEVAAGEEHDTSIPEGEAIRVQSNDGGTDAPVILPPGKVLTTPAVRRIAMENKINLSDIQGTGKDGRILKEDLLHYLQAKEKKSTPFPTVSAPVPHTPAPQATPAPAMAATLPVTPEVMTSDKTEAIKGFKKAMVQTMTAALKIPHFGYCDEIDMTNIVNLKPKLKEAASKHGVRFSYMPLLIKAASNALSHYPVLNAYVDDACENITYKSSHNIGVAMDTPQGLVVPVIKNVQALSLLEIAHHLNYLQDLGLKGSLTSNHITGATFTLSNIGSIGGTYAKPVILPPAVAIGAIGKIQKLPRFNAAGLVVTSHIMQISWSADHRVIDGATMARFSNLWKSYVEEPVNMILTMK